MSCSINKLKSVFRFYAEKIILPQEMVKEAGGLESPRPLFIYSPGSRRLLTNLLTNASIASRTKFLSLFSKYETGSFCSKYLDNIFWLKMPPNFLALNAIPIFSELSPSCWLSYYVFTICESVEGTDSPFFSNYIITGNVFHNSIL